MPRSGAAAAAASRPPPMARRRERRLKEGGGRRHAGIRATDFVAFVGRVLFASVFLISAYQDAIEFGYDGGPAAKSLEPKFNLFVKLVSTKTGMTVPHVHIKTVIAVTLYLRALGAGFFILYSRFGAFLLLVYIAFRGIVVSDFYNYERESPQFVQLSTQFSQDLALYGALLFFWAKKNKMEEPEDEDVVSMMEMTRDMLLFYWGKKNKMDNLKTKTA